MQHEVVMAAVRRVALVVVLAVVAVVAVGSVALGIGTWWPSTPTATPAAFLPPLLSG
jgi:hypothetical protein